MEYCPKEEGLKTAGSPFMCDGTLGDTEARRGEGRETVLHGPQW